MNPAANRVVSNGHSVWRTGLATQSRVIGALIMRELHTRYGRENIGYLWLILEPMLLALAVASLHAADGSHFGSDIRPVPFAICGYGTFIMFRSLVQRADSALESNMTLLYHRQVTIFDILLARGLLEAASTTLVVSILLSLAWSVGLGNLPARPLMLMLGIATLLAFAFGLSMLVCAATHDRRIVQKFVDPTVYILLPLSGSLYMAKWLPSDFIPIIDWFPLIQIFELIRHGQFEAANLDYVYPIFLLVCCLGLNALGLLAISITRKHVHLN